MDKQTQQYLLALVKKNYGQIAENFDITRQKHLWSELSKLASAVKDGDSILDVGCGNGRLAKAFEGKRINYVGVDSSEKLIGIARSKFPNPKLQFPNKSQIPNSKFQTQNSNNYCHAEFISASNKEILKQVQDDKRKEYKFFVGDILALDKVVREKFDWVFCIAVLHQLPGEDLRVQALKQLRERLKPAGKIILTVWNLWSQKKFKKLIFKFTWLKLFGKNHRLSHRQSGAGGAGKMDWGDILFNWKDSQGKSLSQRYYHAFTMKGLKKIIKGAKLKIEKLYKDEYNYYAILTKN